MTAAQRTFPTAQTRLYQILNDAEFRRSFYANLKKANPWMVGLYRAGLLPLFGLSRTVMLLVTKGCKSGKLRSTPIGYFRIGGVIHIFSAWGNKASWRKNIAAHPGDVWIQIGLRKWPVQAQMLEDEVEIRQTLGQLICESPRQAQVLFGWEPGSDRLEAADFSAMIDKVLIVRFVPNHI